MLKSFLLVVTVGDLAGGDNRGMLLGEMSVGLESAEARTGLLVLVDVKNRDGVMEWVDTITGARLSVDGFSSWFSLEHLQQ